MLGTNGPGKYRSALRHRRCQYVVGKGELMSQFIHIDTLGDLIRSRPDIVSNLNSRIAEGRKSFKLVQDENMKAVARGENTVQVAEATARLATADAAFQRELQEAGDYLTVATRNDNLSGFELVWKGLWS